MAMKLAFILIMASLSLKPSDWKMVETDHFEVLFVDASEKLARSITDDLEREYARVSLGLGVSSSRKIRVVVAPDHDTFIGMQGGGAPDWSSGMAYPSRHMIYLRPLSGAEVRHGSMRAIIAHEITHVLFHQRMGSGSFPTWLDEGMALFMSNEALMSRAENLFSIGVTGKHLSFDELTYGFPQQGHRAAIAYAQSGDFVRFLYSEFGSDAVNDYLDRLARGEKNGDAMEAAFGERLFMLEDKWLSGTRWTYGLIPALSGGAMLWFLMSLLFIFAYIRKRSMAREKRMQMALEEGDYRVLLGDAGGMDDDDLDDDDYYDDEPPLRGLH